jgi:adenylate cyclase
VSTSVGVASPPTVASARSRGGLLLPRAVALPVVPANTAGAILVYVYFNYIDPIIGPQPPEIRQLLLFVAVATTLIGANVYLTSRWLGPLERWRQWLRDGMDAARVPPDVRRRVLNAPLASAVLTMAGWLVAGLFYFPYLSLGTGVSVAEAGRSFVGLVFVAGPFTSALAFLVSEFYWRRQVPLFFPDGRLGREGVLRIPIRMRMAATFFVTAVFPMLLMLLVDVSLARRFGRLSEAADFLMWGFLRAQLFIVAVSLVASMVMAFMTARFVNRPVEALRAAMTRVGTGDFDVSVPVRSTDELGELNMRFNEMVADLRRAGRVREIFGRYVSPAVAQQALERGIAFGGEVVQATAMFVDLRGFTALTQRLPAQRVVEILNEYYAIVERVCEHEGGVITQFLGDGVVVVFGGPLVPYADHARRAVTAAIGLQHALRGRNGAGAATEPLDAGIGICTGEMIAGNVGTGGRVTYTVVGDAVNQASRLQVKTRDIDASILVTGSTRAAVEATDGVRFESRGAVPLKGIRAPVEVYAVAT